MQADLNDSTTCDWTLKVIFSEYGWPDPIASDNGPCYTTEAFTKTMQEYRVNHITSSTHYPQSNGLAEKFVQTVKSLFHNAREEGVVLYKALMIYQNTPLTSNMQSLIQILQNRMARSQLPLSNSARRQLGLETEKLRIKMKNENFSSHDLHLGQDVMMQDPTSKRWSQQLPSHYKRQCNIQEDTSTPEVLQARGQECTRCEKLQYAAT